MASSILKGAEGLAIRYVGDGEYLQRKEARKVRSTKLCHFGVLRWQHTSTGEGMDHPVHILNNEACITYRWN